MTVYIKDFKFKTIFNTQYIGFKYYTGYEWKKIFVKCVINDNIAVYTRFVLDCVIKDLCGNEKDPLKRDIIIKKYNNLIACVSQLNKGLFVDATKIFN